MAYGLTNVGEEAILRHFYREDITKPASLNARLYNDTTDDLQDSEVDPSTVVTTQPTGAAYAAQTITFGTTDFDTLSKVGGDYRVLMADIGWDLSDSSETVDSWYLTINFNSTEAGGTGDWIFLRGSLGETVDASTVGGTYTLADAGHSMD